MKGRFALGAMLLAGLAVCVWCSADGPTAINPGVGRSRGPQPDLVIKSLSLSSHTGIVSTIRATVVVRNIGTAASGPCVVRLHMMGLGPIHWPGMAAANTLAVFGQQHLPMIAPGAEAQVIMERQESKPGTCILIAMVDAPASAMGEAPFPLGLVAEKNEFNNVFAMPYDGSQPLPQAFDNPAVQ